MENTLHVSILKKNPPGSSGDQDPIWDAWWDLRKESLRGGEEVLNVLIGGGGNEEGETTDKANKTTLIYKWVLKWVLLLLCFGWQVQKKQKERTKNLALHVSSQESVHPHQWLYFNRILSKKKDMAWFWWAPVPFSFVTTTYVGMPNIYKKMSEHKNKYMTWSEQHTL